MLKHRRSLQAPCTWTLKLGINYQVILVKLLPPCGKSRIILVGEWKQNQSMSKLHATTTTLYFSFFMSEQRNLMKIFRALFIIRQDWSVRLKSELSQRKGLMRDILSILVNVNLFKRLLDEISLKMGHHFQEMHIELICPFSFYVDQLSNSNFWLCGRD